MKDRPALSRRQLEELAVRVGRKPDEAEAAMAVIQRGIAPAEEWMDALLTSAAEMANYVDAVSDRPKVGEWARMAGLLVETIAKRIEERA